MAQRFVLFDRSATFFLYISIHQGIAIRLQQFFLLVRRIITAEMTHAQQVNRARQGLIIIQFTLCTIYLVQLRSPSGAPTLKKRERERKEKLENNSEPRSRCIFRSYLEK